MSASIWAPESEIINIDAESTLLSQVFTATEGQVVFTLTQFSYTPGSSSLAVFRNGQKLVLNVDYSETSTVSFSLLISVSSGELIEALGLIGSSNANAVAAAASAAQAAASAAEAAASAASINTDNFAVVSGTNATGTWPISISGNANTATTATTATTANAIADGAVSTTAKIANNVVTTAKLAREGTAGQYLSSNGAGADPSYVDGPNPITSATVQATTSGTSIDFTGIPSWVKRITVMLKGVSTNGTSSIQLQLGTSGGVETTGYLGATTGLSASSLATSNATTGIQLDHSSVAAAAAIRNGAVSFVNISGTSWAASGSIGRSDTTINTLVSYSKTLSNTLDRIRLTTLNGTDTFDAGSVNILYEG